VVVIPCLPLRALRPHHLLVAAQQHGIEHALQQRVIGLRFPARRSGCRDQFAAAGEIVEIFDDDVGIEDDVAIVEDQHRQFLQRIDVARVVIVRSARRHRGGNQFDLVDQSSLDRSNTHLARKRRGGREGQLHWMPQNKNTMPSLRGALATKQSTPQQVVAWIASLRSQWRRESGAVGLALLGEDSERYASTISCRCSPRLSMPRVTTSPTLRYCGGFMPVPTPGGVPVVMMSPGSSVMNCET
jgi:hypothetical protein